MRSASTQVRLKPPGLIWSWMPRHTHTFHFQSAPIPSQSEQVQSQSRLTRSQCGPAYSKSGLVHQQCNVLRIHAKHLLLTKWCGRCAHHFTLTTSMLSPHLAHLIPSCTPPHPGRQPLLSSHSGRQRGATPPQVDCPLHILWAISWRWLLFWQDPECPMICH